MCIAFIANPKEIFNKLNLFPDYVIKKGATHGVRHGKTEVQREYYTAWNAWKRCCKKVVSQGEHFTGTHDRFLRDPVYRGMNLQKKTTHVISLPRKRRDTKDNGILL